MQRRKGVDKRVNNEVNIEHWTKNRFQIFYTTWNLTITDTTSKWNIISANTISA